jgi:hypothetical protein
MVEASGKLKTVSPGNPCPFLRALVAQGSLADDIEPLDKVVRTIVEVARRGEGQPELPAKMIFGIAMIAGGLGPLALLRSKRQGLRLNKLRGGPLDKKGVGSGVIDSKGEIHRKNFDRLKDFASPKTSAAGTNELGLDSKDLTSFMDANFKRAEGRRRLLDRSLMNGEWPVLLKVMGKDGPSGRYLSVAELQDLFLNRRLPARMTA